MDPLYAPSPALDRDKVTGGEGGGGFSGHLPAPGKRQPGRRNGAVPVPAVLGSFTAKTGPSQAGRPGRYVTCLPEGGYQKIPCAIMASATLWKPAMLAPATRL